jgi:UDP-4-amino-4,6-dideoxy-N-acetyl-beta-L-altrosamine N-acetyltransferase
MLRKSDFKLRPVNSRDRAQLLVWRNSERVRVNMYTDHMIGEDEHASWFESALIDERARHLVFEERSRAVGFVSFTGISRVHGRCTWAFYLGEVDVQRGAGSVMELLALDFAFGPLALRKLCCEVFSFNASVVRLHERFGFKREGLLRAHNLKGDKYEDIVLLARFAEGWPDERRSLVERLFPKRGGQA